MDVVNPALGRAKRRRRLILSGAAVGVVALVTVALSRLEPAAPSVDQRSLFLDTVRRGEMVRQVRGPGTLVPVEIRWIAAPVAGRVDRIPALAGERVTAETALLELSNPEVEQSALEAEAGLAEAEADYARLAAQLDAEQLTLASLAAEVESEAEQARLQVEADRRLAAEGLVPDLTRRLSETRAAELAGRAELERQRVAKGAESAKAQLAAERARLEQARAMAALRREQLAGLAVRAGIDGVLQEVAVEVGQRVTDGATLARVARPERLKAELRIPETQAKDVALGQSVEVDTRNGVVSGRVARIDPAVQEGTVTVDVELTGELPAGARPDLSVDGTIQIERLEDVLYVGRPAYGQAESTITLFRIEPDGKHALRVPVRLGKASVNTIEITEGLAEGDRVILSDTSTWDGHDRLRIN
ncbi:MAG: efflux RND transporter periplasmic adaptor subunit [Thermoanaerobaculia bacterium]